LNLFRGYSARFAHEFEYAGTEILGRSLVRDHCDEEVVESPVVRFSDPIGVILLMERDLGVVLVSVVPFRRCYR
jgi:hypothetical protein